MSKRLIAFAILLAMLFTACSETTTAPENTETMEENTGIYDLPDESVPTNIGGNSDDENAEQILPNEDVESADTQNITDAAGTETEEPILNETEPSSPTEQTPTASETEPSESETEPTSSDSEPPSQTQTPTEIPEPSEREVDPEQLAALSLFALSMEFPDFELQGFYSNGSRTDGIYAMFVSNGENLTARIYPIENERDTSGSMDIYANEVGFAAFDFVEGVDDDYTEIPQEQYVEHLSGLSGVSVFSH